MKKKDNDNQKSLLSKALVLAMHVYTQLSDMKETVTVIRTGHKCSSPAHTALSMWLDGQIDSMRSLIFSMSSFDYQLLEDMEEEMESSSPDWKAVLGKNGYPVEE